VGRPIIPNIQTKASRTEVCERDIMCVCMCVRVCAPICSIVLLSVVLLVAIA
jgi:hypothetical protein